MFKILIVDSETRSSEKLKSWLEDEKYLVFTASDHSEAIEQAKKQTPHLILLEIALPKIDGIETCIELKKIKELEKTLIVFYTERDEDYAQVSAFNAGADDYILKSTRQKLLLSRINAILKRYNVSYSRGNEVIRNQILKIDRERYLIIKDGKELIMPRKEFELLALMYSSPRKVFSRQELSDKIWGYNVYDKNRTIDVHIGKLREKIGDRLIRTVKGKGYSLEI